MDIRPRPAGGPMAVVGAYFADSLLDLPDDVGFAEARFELETSSDLAVEIQRGAGRIADVAHRVGGFAQAIQECTQQRRLPGTRGTEERSDAAAIEKVAQAVQGAAPGIIVKQPVRFEILGEGQGLEAEEATQLGLEAWTLVILHPSSPHIGQG